MIHYLEKHEHIWRGRNRYSSGNRSCARRSSDPPLQKRQSQSRQIQRVRHSRHVHVGIEMAPPPAARCASGCKAVRCYLRQSQTHGRVSVKRGAPEGRRLRGPQGGTGARACSSGGRPKHVDRRPEQRCVRLRADRHQQRLRVAQLCTGPISALLALLSKVAESVRL